MSTLGERWHDWLAARIGGTIRNVSFYAVSSSQSRDCRYRPEVIAFCIGQDSTLLSYLWKKSGRET